MGSVGQLVTAQDLLERQGRCELVRGELIEMTPAGAEHGAIVIRLTGPIYSHVQANRLGVVFAAETGFHIERDPDTVRAPDIAFVRQSRIPPTGYRGFFQGPPDLAVEVLSPDDRAGEVLAKVQDWLTAGCAVVWVVDPRTRTLSIYRPDGQATVLGVNDRLTGGDVLPGFDLSMAEVFEEA